MSNEVRASFMYEAGRPVDGVIQRRIYESAQEHGVTVEMRQVRGWLMHTSFWTVRGPEARVRGFIEAVMDYLRRLGG